MTKKEAFDCVINAMKAKIVELKEEIKVEYNYILIRKISEEIKGFEDSIEYLEDIMDDLNI